MIECDECGTHFEPMTDASKCPVCGCENYFDEDDEEFWDEFYDDESGRDLTEDIEDQEPPF